MHHHTSLRRLAVGATLAGAALGAIGAGPALATPGNSTCSFDPTTRTVTLTDATGNNPLTVFENSAGAAPLGIPPGAIGATQGLGSLPIFCVGGATVATVTNTDTVNILRSAAASGTDRNVTIDQSKGVFAPGATPDPDGHGEVKINVIADAGTPTDLVVVGTAQRDVIRVTGLGDVNLNDGQDFDTDLRVVGGAQSVTVNAGAGDDDVTGQRDPVLRGSRSATVPLLLNGEAGEDILAGGLAPDILSGGDDPDYLVSATSLSADGVDRLDGGSNIDTATFDAGDIFFNSGVEQKFQSPVGRLALTPRPIDAQAGTTTRLRMSWTHPKAWRDLRTVSLRLERGTKQVGMINVHPRGARLTAHGGVTLVAGSRVTHHGKTVTARLAMRLARSLAGQKLRIVVLATDRHDRQQLEPDAGSILVAK